jgi:hypothetical protein
MRIQLIAVWEAKRTFSGHFFALMLWACVTTPTLAQNINIGANHHNVGFSYYESIGTNFGFYLPGGLNARGHGIVGLMPNGQFTPDGNIWFTQGGGGVIPPFGGYDPNSGLRTGWSVRGPNGGFNFGLHASQGSSTTLGGDSMMLTMPNGGSGFLLSGSMRPFVTGIVPVLGGGPTYLPPLTAGSQPQYADNAKLKPRTGDDRALKSGSSAERGATSLAALRAEADAADVAEEEGRKSDVDRLVAKAKSALAQGKESLAGNYLRSALKKATPEEAADIEATWREPD